MAFEEVRSLDEDNPPEPYVSAAASPGCTVELQAARIEPREASRLIALADRCAPLPEHLRFLKRVRRAPDDPKRLLRLIGDEAAAAGEGAAALWDAVGGRGAAATVRVPRRAPQSRAEYAAMKEDWPVSFHAQSSTEARERERALSPRELARAEELLACAARDAEASAALARSVLGDGALDGAPHLATGLVVVDPASDEVVARAADWRRLAADLAAPAARAALLRHPLKTAAIVALEAVGEALKAQQRRREGRGLRSKRRRTGATGELGGGGGGGAPGAAAAREALAGAMSEAIADEGQYLLTGMDVYTTREPEVFSAMALLHSRVRRVFWAEPDAAAGGLGSRQRLHAEAPLNHAFRVFRWAGAGPPGAGAGRGKAGGGMRDEG